MKRLIMIAALGLAACNDAQDSKDPSTYLPKHKVVREVLSNGQVNQGLHKITIDDTVHVLIYRGGTNLESVTMIQIK